MGEIHRAGLSGLNALTRLPLGNWRDDPDLFALADASLRETIAVYLAEGVGLPPDSADRTRAGCVSRGIAARPISDRSRPRTMSPVSASLITSCCA
jgi:hypothetical protein